MTNLSPGQAQAWLAAIVESSDDAIVSKTLDGIITSWNSGAERLFGYSPREAIGRSITLIIPPDRMQEEGVILDRVRNGQRIDHFETVRVRKDGHRVNISLAVSPIRDNSGVIVGASKIARDITTQKAAEAALRESAARKDEFLALLGHELRNPLAPIRNSIEILRTHQATPELKWVIEMLARQTDHLTRLVDDLLDASRVTRGKVVLQRELLDLNDVLRGTIETSRVLLEERRHTIDFHPSAEPLMVSGDHVRLSQTFVNILNNAAQYTEPGGTITVTLDSVGPNGRVRVVDNGIGIDESALPIIFEMFAQSRRLEGTVSTGLGIGLALSRALIELHGGKIEAYSAGPGSGSEFTVTLPLTTARAKLTA